MPERPDLTNVRRERYGAETGRRAQDRAARWIDRDASSRGEHDDTRPEDAAAIDEVVERLSRDLAQAVDRAPLDDRDELRSYAAELVREDTSAGAARSGRPARRARLSFFAVAVWLAVLGVVLTFIMPPAGIVCFLMAGVAAILAAVLGPGEPPVERTAGDAS